jgi:hypothetical protein
MLTDHIYLNAEGCDHTFKRNFMEHLRRRAAHAPSDASVCVCIRDSDKGVTGVLRFFSEIGQFGVSSNGNSAEEVAGSLLGKIDAQIGNWINTRNDPSPGDYPKHTIHISDCESEQCPIYQKLGHHV